MKVLITGVAGFIGSSLASALIDRGYRVIGIDSLSLRYFTVFGERQRPDMAFFKFIKNALLDKPISVYGDGNQTRDFTFVSDIVDANIKAAESNIEGIFNIGGGNRVTLNEAISEIERQISKKIKIEYKETQRGDMHDTLADIKKAKTYLSFNPKIDLKEGLSREIEWLKKDYK